jgi:transcriptional regulator with XRE-family HTH domain
LRDWRNRRGLSQLDLAVAADVSARHVSFLETGRAQPSREMVLRLAATLNIPLREQNALLRAAGLADEFPEPSAVDGLPASILHAIELMLTQHEPFPMTMLDSRYDVLRMNQGAARLLPNFIAEPAALPERLNAMVALFDPRLMRPYIVDWERIAHGLIARLHREALTRGDDGETANLLRSLLEYPGVPAAWRQPDFSSPNDPVLIIHLRRGELALGFLSTITVFNAPQNVTLEELRVESLFPLDEATAQACKRIA